MPVTQTAGKILDGGLRARLEDVDGSSLVGEVAEKRCRDAALLEGRVGRDLSKVKQVGFDSIKLAFAERGPELPDCLASIRAVHNHLRQHGIVIGRNFGS